MVKTLNEKILEETAALVDEYGFEYVINAMQKIADDRVKAYLKGINPNTWNSVRNSISYDFRIITTWYNYYVKAAAMLKELTQFN